MQYFKAENLTKIYVTRPIIDHLSFTVEKGQKIALVAKNWEGKSTLLKLMMEKLDITEGTIEWKKWLRIGYLPQEFSLDQEKTVLDEIFWTNHLAAEIIKSYENLVYDEHSDKSEIDKIIQLLDENQVWGYQAKVDTIISRLNIQSILSQKIKTISWWEKKRVALVKILIDEPEMLVLDEPTNHLDVQMIEWLEQFLKTESSTLFMVTHDRYFLENVCDEIYELERWKIYRYPADYSLFLEKQEERHQNERIENEKLKQLLKRELTRIRKSPRARATKQYYREKEFYRIEKQYDIQKEILGAENWTLDIPIQERRLWTKILSVKKLNKSFWEKKIVKDFSHDFKNCERIWLLGKNWVWKTSFVSLLLGKLEQDSWTIEVWKTVVFWHYQQEEIDFPENKTVLEYVEESSSSLQLWNWEKLSASKLLERFLFTPQQQHQPARKLSWWEKRRLSLLKILMGNPNFLILDEPTNDLDLLTITILEDFLSQYKWCLIIVSHDRYFMDRLVDHLFIFEWEWIITDFWWSYSERNKKQEEKKVKNKGKNVKQDVKIQKVDEDSNNSSKLTYEEKLELNQILKDLEELEKEKAEITQLFNNKDLAYDDISLLSEHLWEIIKTIERKESRRFELIEKS